MSPNYDEGNKLTLLNYMNKILYVCYSCSLTLLRHNYMFVTPALWHCHYSDTIICLLLLLFDIVITQTQLYVCYSCSLTLLRHNYMFVTPALCHYSDTIICLLLLLFGYSDTIICLLLLLFGYSDTIICLYDNRIRYKIYNLEHLLLVDEKYIMLVKVGAWIVVWTDVLSTIKKRRDKVEEYY